MLRNRNFAETRPMYVSPDALPFGPGNAVKKSALHWGCPVGPAGMKAYGKSALSIVQNDSRSGGEMILNFKNRMHIPFSVVLMSQCSMPITISELNSETLKARSSSYTAVRTAYSEEELESADPDKTSEFWIAVKFDLKHAPIEGAALSGYISLESPFPEAPYGYEWDGVIERSEFQLHSEKFAFRSAALPPGYVIENMGEARMNFGTHTMKIHTTDCNWGALSSEYAQLTDTAGNNISIRLVRTASERPVIFSEWDSITVPKCECRSYSASRQWNASGFAAPRISVIGADYAQASVSSADGVPDWISLASYEVKNHSLLDILVTKENVTGAPRECVITLTGMKKDGTAVKNADGSILQTSVTVRQLG